MLFPVPASECVRGPDALMVLVAVVGSILLVGLLLLAAWKLVITIHDRREFARFQSARSRARYEMVRMSLTHEYYSPIMYTSNKLKLIVWGWKTSAPSM